MITADKITEIFCAVDEFCKEFDNQIDKKSLISSDGKRRRYRKASLSDSEIMTILIVFQFGSFRNFKHYYQFFIKQHALREPMWMTGIRRSGLSWQRHSMGNSSPTEGTSHQGSSICFSRTEYIWSRASRRT